MTRDVAILGATASGKTALAMALATLDGTLELASADAYACYRHMDIGTAKPTRDEQAAARWHLIDIVEPTVDLSITRFQRAARQVRTEVHARGHRVVFVGGSGLYLRSVIDDLQPPPRFETIAAGLESQADEPSGLAALYRELEARDPIAAARITPSNRRRIVRALEVCIGTGRPFSSFGPGMQEYPMVDCLQIGLRLDRAELELRLARRLEAQLEAGFVDEVCELLTSGVELSRTAAQAIGYRELHAFISNECTFDEARAEILRRSRNLARRQLAWLRRDPRIHWVDADRVDLEDVVRHLIAEGVRPRDGIGA